MAVPFVGGVVMEQVCEGFARVCRSVGVDVQWCVEMPRSNPVVYCLTEPSPYALMAKGRKLCGFAIRAYAAAWLIQGSLLVRPLPEAIRAVMPEPVRFDYETRAVCLEQAAGMAIADETLVNGVNHALRHV